MHPFINIAIRAARRGGDIVFRYHNQLDRLSVQRKADKDFVSQVDTMAEEAIIGEILKAYPNHSILAEESGEIMGDSPYQWVIDPLDGSTNFLHGLPHYAVSIALFEHKKPSHAVVYDPFKEELFHASIGRGAFLNDKRLRVSAIKRLKEALIGTRFSV